MLFYWGDLAAPRPRFGHIQKKTAANLQLSENHCGDKEIRTLDPLLAKQVLYQLSYTPLKCRPARS